MCSSCRSLLELWWSVPRTRKWRSSSSPSSLHTAPAQRFLPTAWNGRECVSRAKSVAPANGSNRQGKQNMVLRGDAETKVPIAWNRTPGPMADNTCRAQRADVDASGRAERVYHAATSRLVVVAVSATFGPPGIAIVELPEFAIQHGQICRGGKAGNWDRWAPPITAE